MILERKRILEQLGGINEPVVKNKEWIYLLEEETRNSILIEGFFIDKNELKNVLNKGLSQTRSQQEAYNYFSTARFVYGLAYQNFKENEFYLNIPLIRQINKELGYTGEFRKGEVRIAGSGFIPPEFNLNDWLKCFVDFVNGFVSESDSDFIEKLCVSHAFFEEIHPFEDGNGRTGRILLNYILISKGYPLVIIKGVERDKQKYYKALEEIDNQHQALFTKFKTQVPHKEYVFEVLQKTKADQLKKMIENALRESMDRIILERLEQKGEKLKPVSELLSTRGYKEGSHRKLIERGKIIAVKKNNTWFSTENIVMKFL